MDPSLLPPPTTRAGRRLLPADVARQPSSHDIASIFDGHTHPDYLPHDARQCSSSTIRGMVYRSSEKALKPSGDDRRALSRIIVTQVRSLHVHFQSFVFPGDAEKPDLTKPYLLDWARPPSPDMYQHPEYQVDKSLWFYQVWSLMMVLSEIPEWRPLDGEGQDKAELLKKKWERKRLVMSPSIPARFDKMTQQNGRE